MPRFLPLPFSHFDWTNPDLLPDRTASPPYDVLSPAQRQELAGKSPCNMVHIDLPGSYPEADRLLGQWLDQGQVVPDEPAYYIMATRFSLESEEDQVLTRWGVFGGLQLSPWGQEGVYPHEKTYAKAKTDRLELMRATRAQLSPIFGVFDDPGLDLNAMGREVADLTDPLAVYHEGQVSHHLWRLPPKFEQTLAKSLAGREVYIADGHHRYETALNYQAERGPGGGHKPWDFVFACLCNLAMPGVVIEPYHRVIVKAGSRDFPEALAKARAVFDVRAMKDLSELADSPVEAAFALEFGGAMHLLQPKTAQGLNPGQAAFARIGAYIAAKDFLLPCLGLSEADLSSAEILRYTASVAEARQALAQGQAEAALYLKPVSMDVIRQVSKLGQTMPRKSTYFYPKVPTGLILHIFR